MGLDRIELVVGAREDEHAGCVLSLHDHACRLEGVRSGDAGVQEHDVRLHVLDEAGSILCIGRQADDLEARILLQPRLEGGGEEAVVVQEKDSHGLGGGGSRHAPEYRRSLPGL